MIIGNKSIFAIETELDEYIGGDWLYGKFCYWICNKKFGLFQLATGLNMIRFMLNNIVKNNSTRNVQTLFTQNKHDIYYNYLLSTIWGDKFHKYYAQSVKEKWQKLNITPEDIPEFYGVTVLLIDGKEKSKIIAYDYDEGIYECHCELGYVDNVLKKGLETLDKWYQKYGGDN